MKIFLTLLVVFFAINFSVGQTPKYIYCFARLGDGSQKAVSDVVDVTKLPSHGVKRIGYMGKKSLLDYYNDVAMAWWIYLIKKNGYTPEEGTVSVVLVSFKRGADCTDGNQDSCFNTSKSDMEYERTSYINSNKESWVYIK